jgi:mRNA-degrading endonuclease RelE of RelBE toxin-antitoxin system
LAKGRFAIVVWPAAQDDLGEIETFYRSKIASAIHDQLSFQPDVPTRNRKELVGVVASFEFEPPLWELRVDEYRVFYDFNIGTKVVNVRAVRHKPPGTTTAEVLR